MNILARKQEAIYDSNLSKEEQEKRQEEFYDLYFKTRDKDEKSFLGNLSLKTRQRLHKLIFGVFIIKNKLSGFSCDVLKDERNNTDRPVIFAPTHVGKFDIEVSAIGIKDHFYLLSGDYENLQGIIDGKFLMLNGVLFFNENVKSDRVAVAQKMITHLKSGGNLMFFPEGAWNLKPELPVLPLYWGIIDIAQKSNAIIVPVAIEQYGKKFKVNIGKNFDAQLFGSEDAERVRATEELRNILATLKWEIWETEPQLKRDELQSNMWDNYVNSRISEWNFTVEHIENLIFKPKDVCVYTEVFAHIKNLIPSRKTAFLFNQSNK